MAEAAAPLDAAARQAIDRLADIVVPPPVSWMPQTWGWAALAGSVALIAAWTIWRTLRHRAANRYRREALAELDRLRTALADDVRRGAALAAMAGLLKRVALAAWPRVQVATLSGAGWVGFLRAHAGLSDAAARLVGGGEYQTPLPVMSPEEARQAAQGVRHWIETHRVSA